MWLIICSLPMLGKLGVDQIFFFYFKSWVIIFEQPKVDNFCNNSHTFIVFFTLSILLLSQKKNGKKSHPKSRQFFVQIYYS